MDRHSLAGSDRCRKQVISILSEAEEIAIRSIAKEVGSQWGEFMSTALAEFLTLVVALRKPGTMLQVPGKPASAPLAKTPPASPQSPLPVNRLLKAVDVASRLYISKVKAYQLLQKGEIPSIRMGRTTWVRPVQIPGSVGCKILVTH